VGGHSGNGAGSPAAPQQWQPLPGQPSSPALAQLLQHLSLFPTYHIGFFLYVPLLEGCSLEEVWQRFSSTFLPTIIKGSSFWPLAHSLNFRYVGGCSRRRPRRCCCRLLAVSVAMHGLAAGALASQSACAAAAAAAALQVPPQYRVLFSAAAGLVWNVYPRSALALLAGSLLLGPPQPLTVQ
jgi:hypothetical protein